MSNYHYIDPRGRRSGPFTENELKLLAERGLLELNGSVELDGVSVAWPVSDIPWLRSQLGGDAPPPPSAPAAFVPPPPPENAPAPAVPPTSPSDVFATPVPQAVESRIPACSRVLYVLLALLLPFIGIFGVHNVVAGYTTRGIVALVLSVATIFGIGCVLPPCACVSVPVWLVLFTLSVIDAITVRCDAKGRPFA